MAVDLTGRAADEDWDWSIMRKVSHSTENGPSVSSAGRGGADAGIPLSQTQVSSGPPTPPQVRTALVEVVRSAGHAGLLDGEAERAVARRFPDLEDPLDADIESLLLLGVLKRSSGERLSATDVAERYLVGVRAASV